MCMQSRTLGVVLSAALYATCMQEMAMDAHILLLMPLCCCIVHMCNVHTTKCRCLFYAVMLILKIRYVAYDWHLWRVTVMCSEMHSVQYVVVYTVTHVIKSSVRATPSCLLARHCRATAVASSSVCLGTADCECQQY
jgi:hypothetical protein